MRPYDACIAAAAAEAMYAPGLLTPALDTRLEPDWTLVDYVAGRDALFGAQRLGLGDMCYYGFLARSLAFPNRYVLALRGTENWVEWVEDFEAAYGPNGTEAGFWSIYDSLRYGTLPLAQGVAAELSHGDELTVVGHSLGSALAAYALRDILPATSVGVSVAGQMFACPHPATQDWCRRFHAAVPAYTVYQSPRDVVTRLPLSLPFGTGFQALPNVLWLDPKLAAIPDRLSASEWLVQNHKALNYAKMVENL